MSSLSGIKLRSLKASRPAIAFVLAVFIYVVSLVPVGRLYMIGTLKTGTWHESIIKTIYEPLLYLGSHNRMVYSAIRTQSELLSHISAFARKDAPVSLSFSWWYLRRMSALGDASKRTLKSGLPDPAEFRKIVAEASQDIEPDP
ncbi:MAG: hypothetical protein ACAI35_27860 [Candidatus Methylacidiphilales bacterium]|nr:hypothetical protein [Candidatus Methylacidiphilales bacterium]